MEFLRFCKNLLNPGVQTSDKTIDFHLLPSTLFDSKFEYKNYILTYDDLIEKNKRKRKNEESKHNFDLNNKNKTISLQNVLNIIFSFRYKRIRRKF